MRLMTGVLIMASIAGAMDVAHAQTDDDVRRLVVERIQPMLPANNAGGAAVVIRLQGRTLFLNIGPADLANGRPITPDSLFNLASLGKIFDATLLAQAIRRGEIGYDDPVVKYIPDLEQGGDIRRVTIGQLASHTSGLLLPQDHPPWPEQHYALPEFIRTLNEWKADEHHRPGEQHLYTHAGYILLHLALERRFGLPLRDLLDQRIFRPLDMTSTMLPPPGVNVRGELDPSLKHRAVQGYEDSGKPIGEPGDVQGYYLWPGTSQVFSSPRDMALFLVANMGEVPGNRSLQGAMELAHRGVFPISPRNTQALAWEINLNSIPIIEKNGGLDNTSSYIGFVPSEKIGIVILSNRGNQNPAEVGRLILLDLAKREAATTNSGGR